MEGYVLFPVTFFPPSCPTGEKNQKDSKVDVVKKEKVVWDGFSDGLTDAVCLKEI